MTNIRSKIETKFKFILISSANENDTLAKFNNSFIIPKYLETGDWYVSLQTFFLHNELKKDVNKKVSAYKVLCNILDPWPNTTNILRVVPRISSQTGFFYQPGSLEKIKINPSTCTNVKIDIVPLDKNGKEIREALLAGQPTVIELIFENMLFTSNSTRVFHIESKGQDHKYPNNKSSSFSADTSAALNLCQIGTSYGYELALSSITFVPEFSFEKRNRLIKRLGIDSKHVLKSSHIEQFKFSSEVQTFIWWINIKLKALNRSKEKNRVNSILIDTHVVNGKNILFITSKIMCIIEIPLCIVYNMGLRDVTKNGIEQPDKNTVRFTFSTKNTIINMDTEYMPGAFGPEIGMLYCDAIKSTQLGNTTTNILAVFPIKKTATHNYVSHAVNYPDYIPISKLDLSTMKFELRDIGGEYLPFTRNNNVILSLLIRRNKMTQYTS